MKLLNLKRFSKLRELNKSLKKYSMLIMSGLFLFMKKEKMSNMVVYLVISLLGYMLLNNEKKNMKMQDKNEYYNSEDTNENENPLEDFFDTNEINDETDNEMNDENENSEENEENY